MARRIDINKLINKYENANSPFVRLNISESDNEIPYVWSSVLSNNLDEVCPLKAAYDILDKYKLVNLTEKIDTKISSGLQRLFDQANEEERRIANAVTYTYKNALYNYRIPGVGKADLVVNDEVIEIKFTSKVMPEQKWLYQIASYMNALEKTLGQIVMVSRNDYSVSCFEVERENDQFFIALLDMVVSIDDISMAKNKIEKYMFSIKNNIFPDPPYEKPSRKCVYSRNSIAKRYYQCHGITASNSRCKKAVIDNPLCDLHSNQTIVKIEDVEPIIKAQIDCPYFNYCWKYKRKFGEIEI